MKTENDKIKKVESDKNFEESIQEQIKEHEQNPSVILNGAEFLEKLSLDIKNSQQGQSPALIQTPQKSSNEGARDQLIKQLRQKFELLKQLKKGKDQEREI